MSYEVKYTCTHKKTIGNATTTYLIEILKKDYEGSSTDVKGSASDGVFRLSYDNTNPQDLFKNRIQKGTLQFYLQVAGSLSYNGQTIADEIFAGDEKEFQMRLSINGNVEFTGWVLNDLGSSVDGKYAYPAEIVAKDLSIGSGIDYSLTDDRVTLSVTLADFLDEIGLDLNIYTYTSWITEDTTDSDDFLNQIYNDRYGFRTYANNGDETDQPITVEECLTRFLTNYGLILRQSGNAWRVYQLTALSDPENVKEFVYNSSGVQQSDSTVDLTVDVDRVSRFILPGGSNEKNKALWRVKNTFNHRTQLSGVKLPRVLDLSEDSGLFTQFLISDGEQKIRVSGRVEATLDDGASGLATAQIRINPNGHWWDGSAWQESAEDIDITLDLIGPAGGGNYTYIGEFSIYTSLPVPSDADGTLNILFKDAFSDTGSNVVTVYRDLSFVIENAVAEENSTSIDYQLTQTGNYSSVKEIDATYFGDGPAPYSRSALRYGSSDSALTSSSWQFRGITTGYRVLHENLLKEVLDPQRVISKNYRGELLANYSTKNVIVKGSQNLFFLGGTLTGRESVWDGFFIEINVSTGADSFEDIPKFSSNEEGNSSSSSPSGFSGYTKNESDARYFQITNNLSEGTASTIRSNLGLAIGSDVQGHSDALDDISLLDDSDGNIIVGSASGWVAESGATARASLGADNASNLIIGTLPSGRLSGSYTGITGVGALGTGSIVSTFGNIDIGTSTLKAGATVINASGNALQIKGVGSPDATDSFFLSFYRSDGTRAGFLGDSSSGNQNIVLRSDLGNINLDSGSNAVNVLNTLNVTGLSSYSANSIWNNNLAIQFKDTGGSSRNTLSLNGSNDVIIGASGGGTQDIRFYSFGSERNSIEGDIFNGVDLDFLGTATVDVLDVANTSTFGGVATFEDDIIAEQNVFVEGGIFAKEFVVDTTRVFLSGRFGSGGIIGEIVDATVGSEKVKFVDNNGNAITPFADNDLFLIQVRTGVNSGTIVKRIKRKVVADSQPSNVVSLTKTGVTTGTDVGTIAVGDDAVLDGNTTDTTRDSFIAIDVLDRDIAAFGFFDGQTDFGNGTEAMRVGGMDTGGTFEYDSSITGKIGIAGKIGSDLAFVLTESEGLVGGTNFDSDYLWTGTKQTSNGYSTSGYTFAKNGAIRTPQLRVDTDGSAHFRGSIVIGATNKIWLNDGGDGKLAIGGTTKANAPFFVQADGKFIYNGMGEIIYDPFRLADFNDVDSETVDPTTSFWICRAEALGLSAYAEKDKRTITTTFKKRFGLDTIALNFHTKYTRTSTDLSFYVNTIRLIIKNSAGSTVLSESYTVTSSSYVHHAESLDISSLTDDDLYTLQVYRYAKVTNTDSGSPTMTGENSTYLRADVLIISTP